MNVVKNAALTSLAIAKEAACPENLHAGLVAAAGKSKEWSQAGSEAAGQVSHWRALSSLARAFRLTNIHRLLVGLPPTRARQCLVSLGLLGLD